jgi:hypothetical protein
VEEMEKIISGVYVCKHGVEITKKDMIQYANHKLGLPGNNASNDAFKHLRTCNDSGVAEKIGKYSRELTSGPEFNSYEHKI